MASLLYPLPLGALLAAVGAISSLLLFGLMNLVRDERNPALSQFPIDAVLARICSEVRPGQTVLLQAPPGAGKTTRVPLALIGALSEGQDVFGEQQKIWMIEPRRLATKAAAARLAATLGEEIGVRIGYAVRGEQKRSSQTRVEVITDGLFLRRLQSDRWTGWAA